MTQPNRLKKALSLILPAGAIGASLLLSVASTEALASSSQGAAPNDKDVSTRLQAIRSAVSDLSGSAVDPQEGDPKAAPTWWGNGGWGRWRMGWGNGGGWHNGGWGNGGWRNGGWGNGGWHNGWQNGWHNW